MAKTYNIYREDEAKFPRFRSVQTARNYFKRNYRGEYTEGYAEYIGDNCLCYFDELNDQPVQIMEYDDGSILYMLFTELLTDKWILYYSQIKSN